VKFNKRQFLKASGAALAAFPFSHAVIASKGTTKGVSRNSALKNLTENVTPISVKERQARIAKAQQLMQKHNIAAMILEPGAAMDYFSGIQWWRSERLTAVVIPKEGEIGVICPFFEEPSIRESLAVEVKTFAYGKNTKVRLSKSNRYWTIEKSIKALSPLKIQCDISCSTGSCRYYPICKILAPNPLR
jgi:hypothetical protein